jgi:hypothetical protein
MGGKRTISKTAGIKLAQESPYRGYLYADSLRSGSRRIEQMND